jgi:hypothetical protein
MMEKLNQDRARVCQCQAVLSLFALVVPSDSRFPVVGLLQLLLPESEQACTTPASFTESSKVLALAGRPTIAQSTGVFHRLFLQVSMDVMVLTNDQNRPGIKLCFSARRW